MPRLPPTPHSMEANEPCLGRWVHDDASGLEGLVIEVKTGGWRVVLVFGAARRLPKNAGARPRDMMTTATRR